MAHYCCNIMEAFIKDPEVPIEYDPITRTYSLVSITASYRNNNEVCISFNITHCPRCGRLLPKNLAQEWSDIVHQQFYITDELDEEQIKSLPEEFKTDQWWKNRRL